MPYCKRTKLVRHAEKLHREIDQLKLELSFKEAELEETLEVIRIKGIHGIRVSKKAARLPTRRDEVNF